MSAPSTRLAGWRGATLVAITYIYFLIFAQFAFLKRVADLGIADAHLKAVMAAMALGGILLSLFAAKLHLLTDPAQRLRTAFAACAAAALLTLAPLNLPAAIAVSALIGCSLGLLTVTLVTHLRLWLAPTNPLLQVGIGTGLGYFVCNFPPLFTASPTTQAVVAAALCLLGIAAATAATNPESAIPTAAKTSLLPILLAFTALVWLDSAAFFIIQSTPALKSGTWQGTAHLWTNAALHLTAAVVAGLLLARRSTGFVLNLAVAALAAACLLLQNPAHTVLASLFYPIGVSLYSVALVAYPSLLSGSPDVAGRARTAGLLYALAGWTGSALGIGMGQNLGRVPLAFVALALMVVAGPSMIHAIRIFWKEAFLTATVALAALSLTSKTASVPTTAAERGRRVYIAEGCINCHSQYVRPGTQDELIWGPSEPLAATQTQRPPLIGNRRQGPDLQQIGLRRSPLWLKAHFLNPAEVSHGSFMPSYGYLFTPPSTRGDDLIAYLQTLRPADPTPQRKLQQSWQPATTGNPDRVPALFNAHCATCHLANGATRQRWQADFRRLPPDLTRGPFLHLHAADTRQLAQIIKFGIPETDMPGHEYLSDSDVASLTLWLAAIIPQPTQPNPQTQGDHR